MTVIRNADLPRAGLPGLEHATLAGSQNGLKNLSVWRQTVAPGAATPPHRHDCEEVVLVLSGAGALEIGGARHAFGADSTLVLPRNEPHQIFNTGDVPMEIVGIFATTPVEVFLPDGERLDLPWAT